MLVQGKRASLASRLLKLQLAISYILYFVVISAVTVNMLFLSNWWARLIPPEMYPVPVNIQNVVGVGLILTLILLHNAFLVALRQLKKKAEAEKRKETETFDKPAS